MCAECLRFRTWPAWPPPVNTVTWPPTVNGLWKGASSSRPRRTHELSALRVAVDAPYLHGRLKSGLAWGRVPPQHGFKRQHVMRPICGLKPAERDPRGSGWGMCHRRFDAPPSGALDLTPLHKHSEYDTTLLAGSCAHECGAALTPALARISTDTGACKHNVCPNCIDDTSSCKVHLARPRDLAPHCAHQGLVWLT